MEPNLLPDPLMPAVTISSKDLALVLRDLTRGKRVDDGAALARIGLAALGYDSPAPEDPMATSRDDVINYLNRAQEAEEELGAIRQMLMDAGIEDCTGYHDGKGCVLTTRQMVEALISDRDRWMDGACGPAEEPPKKRLPTHPGWWTYQYQSGDLTAVQVTPTEDGSLQALYSGGCYPLASLRGEWGDEIILHPPGSQEG